MTILLSLVRAFNAGVSRRNRVPGATLEQKLKFGEDIDCEQLRDNINKMLHK